MSLCQSWVVKKHQQHERRGQGRPNCHSVSEPCFPALRLLQKTVHRQLAPAAMSAQPPPQPLLRHLAASDPTQLTIRQRKRGCAGAPNTFCLLESPCKQRVSLAPSALVLLGPHLAPISVWPDPSLLSPICSTGAIRPTSSIPW